MQLFQPHNRHVYSELAFPHTQGKGEGHTVNLLGHALLVDCRPDLAATEDKSFNLVFGFNLEFGVVVRCVRENTVKMVLRVTEILERGAGEGMTQKGL